MSEVGSPEATSKAIATRIKFDTDEKRRQAVREVNRLKDGGKTDLEACAEVGISVFSYYTWKKTLYGPARVAKPPKLKPPKRKPRVSWSAPTQESKYKIEYDVPPPGKPTLFPIDKLEVRKKGDKVEYGSFEFPIEDWKRVDRARSNRRRKNKNAKFTMARLGKVGRIWRIK